MDVVVQIAQFIAIISLLVVLHELGHFIPAKLFKTKVEKFYLFFDVKYSLFKKKIGETVYGIGWLPLGGYVKIAGMIDESMDKEQMKLPPKPYEFRSKPAWQRLIIMVGGVVVNVLLAWLIYATLLITQGDSYIPVENLKDGLQVTAEGQKLGFQEGDQIVAVDGEKIKRFDEIMLEVILADTVEVIRNEKKIFIPITDEALGKVFTGLKNPFFAPRVQPIIGHVRDTLNAGAAGLKKGDRILAANDKPITYWNEFVNAIDNTEDADLKLLIDRNGTQIEKSVFVDKGQAIGVGTMAGAALFKTDEYSFGEGIPEGFKKTFRELSKQIRQFKVIFKPKTKAYTQVKGPIGIIEVLPKTWDWGFFWRFTAMFSVWLAFVNILPIPALDGGHVMFLLYEMITGRKPSEKVLEYGQIAGFIFLVALMGVIFGNDIWNIIKRFL